MTGKIQNPLVQGWVEDLNTLRTASQSIESTKTDNLTLTKNDEKESVQETSNVINKEQTLADSDSQSESKKIKPNDGGPKS